MTENLNWKNIDKVFLDLDGTLLDLHFDNHFWLEYVPVCYADHHGLPIEKARTHLMHRYSEVRGKLNWYCVEFWTNDLGLDIGQLKQEVSHKIAVHSNVEPFLERMNVLSKRVVLVTNAHPVSYALKMKVTGLDQYFNNVVNAHDLNKAKEQDGFWQSVQAVEPFDPEKTLFVDDNEEVLACAASYGFTQLRSILKPDSKKAGSLSTRFIQLKNFAEITP